MKTTKRFLSIMLIAIMTFCLSAFNVSADDDWSYQILLNDANKSSVGQIFIAYKVFALTQEGNAFNYEANNTCLKSTESEYGYTIADLTDETVKDNNTMLAFGRSLATMIAANSYNQGVTRSDEATIGENGNATITVNEKGYYAIFKKQALTKTDGTDNANSFIALISCPENGTATSSTINLKEAIPTLDKKIWHNENNAWELVGDNQIGDEVNFRLETTVQDNMKYFTDYDYIIHDNLDEAFTFNVNNAALAVWIGEKDVTGSRQLTSEEYSVNPAGLDCNECELHVRINYDAIKELDANTKIYTYYKAKLNGTNIKIWNNPEIPNQNTAWLEYTNDPHVTTNHGKTPEKKVDDWTFTANIRKVASEKVDGEWESLAKAKFKVYKSNDGNPIPDPTFMTFTAGESGTYTVSESGSEILEVSSGENTKGQLILKGLDDGVTYYLRETNAPDGYKALTSDVKLKLTATYPNTYVAGDVINGSKPTVSIDNNLNDEALAVKEGNELLIKNISGTALVGTGGIGTTIFYIAGGVLMAGAVVLLIVKRRVNK